MLDARNILITSSFGTVSTLNERINNSVSVWPHIPDAEVIESKPTLCRNATRGPNAWFCYHYAGKVTPGKEALSARGFCEACEIALPPYEEAPSFMKGDED